MSRTILAQVMMGCRLDRLAHEETRSRTVTKYNEDTGIPYQKTVEQTVVVFGCGAKAMEFSRWEDLYEYLDRNDGSKPRLNYDEVILGVELAQVEPHGSPIQVPRLLPPLVSEVYAWLHDLGMAEADWRTWLLVSVS